MSETGNDAEVSPDFDKKHPLNNPWTMWYDKGFDEKTQVWGEHLYKIFTFDTVEDFWRLYNNLQTPRDVAVGSTYHLFKAHIQPKWEDEENRYGGTWSIMIPANKKKDLDDIWLNLVLASIGEAIGNQNDDLSSYITGCVISLRKKNIDKITIWTKAMPDDKLDTLGYELKRILGLESTKFEYNRHQDVVSSGSRPKPYRKI